MDNVMKEEKELKLDKSNWIPTKLGDLASEISKRVDNPSESAYDRFVGLGNFVSGDIKIKTWEPTDNLASSAKAFQAGDILFARRNAYLRRASMVDFDGCCSGDAFILRENHDRVVPGFLAFLLNSNALWDYANSNAAGTMSKRVKWRDLAEYEFLLPPKDQQAKLAELLWAMDEVVEKENEALNNLYDTYSTSINQFMIHGNYGDDGEIVKTKCGLLDKRIKTIKLKECLLEKPTYGANASSKPFENGSLRYIRITDIDDEGNLIEEDKVTIDSTEYSQYILKDQDFLFARTGNTVGKTLLYDSQMEESVFAGYLIRFRVNPIVLKPKFLFYFTKSLKYESFKRKMIKIGAQPNINSEEYQSMVLPCFSIEIQQELIDRLDFMKSNIDSLKSKIQSSKALQKSLINQVF
ncbi:restriction endonuclease subunit S [Mesoflavibacter sp. CH_XMU1422-2]|uniref:restriction endonuclease subunit S n=1 Tax=Mesoflavibacter sp. CH_XMU1422-2 TaxID=3107770 RepID=UPI00300A4B37